MKTVLLIGDSTMFGSNASGGYGIYVKEHFEARGTGRVFLPIENCQDTRFTLNTFDEIFPDCKDGFCEVDVIHWNNGLWDSMHFCGSPRATVPIDRYIRNLAKIHAMLSKKCPRARIVFATSTPVLECKSGGTYRTNAEIREYNAAAVELLSGLGCHINDLYGFADGKLWEHRAPDGVHFNEAGCVKLANRVIEVIEKINA